MESCNCWCYRIDNNYPELFWKELHEGRLRQGWGYEEACDLRKDPRDSDVRRNYSIFYGVKKGDYLLIPHIPDWDSITIAQATEDFDKGYEFHIDEDYGDYGHIFPAKFVKTFNRYDERVNSAIRSTLRSPGRFWNVNYLADSIDKILECNDKLDTRSSAEHIIDNSIFSSFCKHFDEKSYSKDIYSLLNEKLQKSEWEAAFIYGINILFPDYIVEHTGGCREVEHGTDVLVKIPSLEKERYYAIAIQIKDYENSWIPLSVLDQIDKAVYWNSVEGIISTDKILIMTNVLEPGNEELVKEAARHGVRILFKDNLVEFWTRVAKIRIAEKKLELY